LDSKGVDFDVHPFTEYAAVGRAALSRADPARAVGVFDAALGLWRGSQLPYRPCRVLGNQTQRADVGLPQPVPGQQPATVAQHVAGLGAGLHVVCDEAGEHFLEHRTAARAQAMWISGRIPRSMRSPSITGIGAGLEQLLVTRPSWRYQKAAARRIGGT